MLNNDTLTKEAAKYRSDAKKRFDAALAALLTLAWKYKYMGGDFSFSADQELYSQALDICKEMSNGCLEDAEARIRSLFEEEFEIDNESADDTTERLDMAGSHLLTLLDLWIAVAFTNQFTKEYTRISIVRYLNNPIASGLFGTWGKDILKWGSGYSKNIYNQLTVIGQDFIIDASRMQEWREETDKGAIYYVRRRGSSYYCPDCDELCGYPIPIDQPFQRLHARCCCWPEYYYDEMPTP